jgi:hypothetical protein
MDASHADRLAACRQDRHRTANAQRSDIRAI